MFKQKRLFTLVIKGTGTVNLSIRAVPVNSIDLIFIWNSDGILCILFCSRKGSSNTKNTYVLKKIFHYNDLSDHICGSIFRNTIIPVNFTTCQGRHVIIRMHPKLFS